MARRSYMPALVAEHSETRDGRVWRVRVYSEATKADLRADCATFRCKSSGAALVARGAPP
jgi:hypothetical protein